jgi:hypothetical protein
MSIDSNEQTSTTGRPTLAVEDYFYIQNGIESIDFIFEVMRSTPKEIDDICTVFSSNMLGAALNAMAFLVFANRSAYSVGYHGMLGVQLGLPRNLGDSKEIRAQKAREILDKQLKEAQWGNLLKASSESSRSLIFHRSWRTILDRILLYGY